MASKRLLHYNREDLAKKEAQLMGPGVSGRDFVSGQSRK